MPRAKKRTEQPVPFRTARDYKSCSCENCKHLTKLASTITGAQRPAGKGISDDMVRLWNEALRDFPCTALSDATKPTQVDAEAEQRRLDMAEVHKLLRGQRPIFLVTYHTGTPDDVTHVERHTVLQRAIERYTYRAEAYSTAALYVRLAPAEPH